MSTEAKLELERARKHFVTFVSGLKMPDELKETILSLASTYANALGTDAIVDLSGRINETFRPEPTK